MKPEAQFQNTLDLIEDLQFDLVNTAAYSPRPNTPAAVWSDQLSESEKYDRLQRLNRLVSVTRRSSFPPLSGAGSRGISRSTKH